MKKLSEQEAYIMSFFWESGPMKTDQLNKLVSQKEWKSTTLLTFLSRLVAKEALLVQKQGKSNLYTPLFSKDDYRLAESTAFLNEMYGGSSQAFLSAMVQSRGISHTELDELKSWLDNLEVDHDD